MTTIIAPSDTVSLQAQQSALSITGWGGTISDKGFLARESKSFKSISLLSNFHPRTFCNKVAILIIFLSLIGMRGRNDRLYKTVLFQQRSTLAFLT